MIIEVDKDWLYIKKKERQQYKKKIGRMTSSSSFFFLSPTIQKTPSVLSDAGIIVIEVRGS